MRAFKTFVGYVVFYTQPTKGSKSTTDCRQVNAEKPTKPAKNRQILKKAGKISLKSHEKTDNELYISGCTFSAAGGRRPGRSRDRAETGRRPAKHRPKSTRYRIWQENGPKEALFRTKNGAFRSTWGLSRVCNLKTDVSNIII